MKDLKQMIEDYGATKAEKDSLEKKLELLNKEIKEEFAAQGIKQFDADNYKCTVWGSTTTTYLNSLIPVVKELGFNDVIKESINRSQLEAHMKVGTIPEVLVEPHRVISSGSVSMRVDKK